MGREDFTDRIRDKSNFEVEAERKISDAREFTGNIQNSNLTISHGLSSARNIQDKLSSYKYETALDAGDTVSSMYQKTEEQLSNPANVNVTREYIPDTFRTVQRKKARVKNHNKKNFEDFIPKRPSNKKMNKLNNRNSKFSENREKKKNSPEQKNKQSDFVNSKQNEAKSFKNPNRFEEKEKLKKLRNVGNEKNTDRNDVNGSNAGGKYGRYKAKEDGVSKDKARTRREKEKAHFHEVLDRHADSKYADLGDSDSTKRKSNKVGRSSRHQKNYFRKKIVENISPSRKYIIKADSKKNGQITLKKIKSVEKKYKNINQNEEDEEEKDEGVLSDVKNAAYRKLQQTQNVVINNTDLLKKEYKKYVDKTQQSSYIKQSNRTIPSDSFANDTRKSNEARNKKIQQKKMEKKFRQAKAEQKAVSEVMAEGKQALTKMAHKIQQIAAEHSTVIIIVVGCIIMFILLAVSVSSCAVAVGNSTGTYVSGLSPAEDIELTGCESYFTEKEMNLQDRIDNIQTEFPDEDEYIFDVDPIGHDGNELMSYLSAVYESYTLSDVQGVLDQLYDEMYTLNIWEEVQIRYRTEEDAYGEEHEVPYNYYILHVELTKNDWNEIIDDKFPDDDARERYDIYLDTGGAHQAFHNPFTVDWSNHISSEFGWRIHPITGVERFHNGVDIALAEGTEVKSCSTGTVIQSYFSSSAGNYVVVQDDAGYTCHYMHLQSRNVSVGDIVRSGDLIGKVGNTGNSTGPHLHLGIKDNNGEWLNPRFMVSSFVGGERQ